MATHWPEGTEAEHFAAIARKMGVPSEALILETTATNTGENMRFTYRRLCERGIHLDSTLLVQKPYMERRTYATFAKQWPDSGTRFLVTSPPITYADYCNDLQPKDETINIMVGDLQRIQEYPKLGFQIEQPIPSDVWAAYEQLV